MPDSPSSRPPAPVAPGVFPSPISQPPVLQPLSSQSQVSWRERLELMAGGDLPDPLRLVGAVVGLASLVVGGWLLLREPPVPVEATLPLARPAVTTTTEALQVVVHASGAVGRPGLYRLAIGARVADLVEAAGGPAPNADLDRLNLAAKLADGVKVHVPLVGEPLPADSSAMDGAVDGPIDVNAATVDQLDELPGIGPATAKAIVDARTKSGRFGSVDELLDVPGIGPAKLAAIRDLVRV